MLLRSLRLAPALLVASALLAGCLSAHPRLDAPEAGPEFRPETFFAGPTRGLGVLAVRGRAPVVVRVESAGALEPDSTFRLEQTVRLGDGPPRRRTWRMRRTGAGTYAATLTEATGPVAGRVEGGVLRLRYRLGRGVVVEQRLRLEPDGRTALNLLTVRVLGVPWARLQETITRAGPTG